MKFGCDTMSNMKIDGFEMCKVQNGQALEFQEGLNIVVFLDSLLERKSLRPLDCLLNWKEEFQMLGIPVVILSPERVNYMEDAVFQYGFDSQRACFKYWNVLKNKSVFGKEHEIIYASMLVFDGNTKIYQAQSISDSSLEKMLIYLSKIWAKKFQKKCEKKFDKR